MSKTEDKNRIVSKICNFQIFIDVFACVNNDIDAQKIGFGLKKKKTKNGEKIFWVHLKKKGKN